MTFKQYDLNFTRYLYTIEPTGLSVTRKKLFSTSKSFIPFERIGSEITTDKESKFAWLICSLIFFIIALTVFIRRIGGNVVADTAELAWLLMSFIFFIVYAFTRKNQLFLVRDHHSEGIEFLGVKVYSKQLKEFIHELLDRRDTYLQTKLPVIEGLTIEENLVANDAGISANDTLFLKKLTNHPIEQLRFDNELYPDTDKPMGICSKTTELNARKIIRIHQYQLIKEGKFIFINSFSGNDYSVGIIGTTGDPYQVMRYAETNGMNYDIDTNDIIAKLQQWDQTFGINIIGIGFDYCECEIKNKDIDYKKLAEEVYEFCPDVVEQGTETIELLEEEIKKSGIIYLWWD